MAGEEPSSPVILSANAAEWEEWTLTRNGDGTFFLRSRHGTYLHASDKQDTDVLHTRGDPSGWEAWTIIPQTPLTDFVHTGALSPVRGCFDDGQNPLVGLNAAIDKQPDDLEQELHMVNLWVDQAATKAKIASVPGLTPDGAMAIWMYTTESPLYTHLNNRLREQDRTALKTYYFPFLRLLLTALHTIAAAGDGQPRMLNRGVKLDLVSMHPDVYATGQKIVWWAFSSCTLDISVLYNPMFLGPSGDRTIFQVHTKHGVCIEPFSAVNKEREVLLLTGTALKITGVLPKDASGLTIITCEDDDDAPPLIC